jgi:DivIVA domain-containing protein
MPLTPADVRNVTFSKPPIGKRGYNEDEVDAFLDLVGADLGRLIEENKDLRLRAERLNQQLRTTQTDTERNRRPSESPRPVMSAVPPPWTKQTSPGGDREVQAAKVLGLAQELADRLTGEAQAEADGVLSTARRKSAQLLSDARAKADGMVTEARARAETMLNDARTRAEVLDRQSRENAASLEREAARKHGEIIGSISQEKSILESKIDELRTLEREYRTHLKIYLDSQLRELDRRGSAEPTHAMRNPQDVVTPVFGANAESGSHHSDPKIGMTAGAGAARS